MSKHSIIPTSLQKVSAFFLIFILLAGVVGTPGSTAQAQTSPPESLGEQVEALLPKPALQAGCITPANEIVAENCLPGNPPSEWDVSGAGDANIQGFATDISINQGGTVHFKIDTNSNNYHIDIYRIGYYNGDGARKVATISPSATLPQNQPACLFDATGGVNLLDCGNWAESASWAVPANATSGLYIAKLVRDDATPGASHITFIVRDDDGNSDLLFQTSDTTWQAYNGYGGYSLYAAPNHAYKVSYNRPFLTRTNSTEDFWFNSEYPMIRWLERNGYDVSYFTDVDSHRNAAEILEHNVFLSVGHDEYWSAEQRTAVEVARDAGVHLAFFNGNSIYWKTRWENSTDGSNTPFRTLVSYKEGSLAGSEHYTCQGNNNCDPDPDTWTGLWRDGCAVIGHDGCNPENRLMGTISWMGNTDTIQVPEADDDMRFWRNTTLAALPSGMNGTLESNTLGYEWDHEQVLYANDYPDGRFWLSTTSSNGQTHHLSMYRAPSGALVFGAGTVQWMWGLDGNHDRGATTEDADMQQATVNLFADMGVQPGTLQNNLTAASASTDSTNPTATITSPISGANAPSGSPLIISGTAADSGGGVVGAVEISLDNGATWIMATGRETWTYTWVPTTPGSTVNIRARAVDDSGNIGAASAPLLVNVTERICPCSIWNDTFTPIGFGDDGQAIEVGVKFQSTEAGYITGLRFYKDIANTGTHIGHLWASNGTQLAEATFTSETASGWQEVYFSTPVQIQANTTYVASYHSSDGGYSFDDQYFAAQFNSPPLRALANGEEGPNGVYNYGASAFPTQTYQSSNYWVDVIFDATPQVYSVWEQGPITGSASVNDPTAIEAGFKFKSDVAGTILGITFYKGATNTGPFIGHLWQLNGTQLAAKNYTNNTADVGWQEILFDTPVHIDANTTYVGSYFTQSGNYAAANNYFTAEVYNAPLHALANSDPDGPNGVYNYGSSAFPQSTFNASNYWVDVLFAPDVPIDNTPPTITSVTPANGTTNVSLGTTVTITFNEAMDPLTLTTSTFELRDGSNNLVPASVTYNSTTRTATLTPNSPLSLTATYTARVIGTASGAKDAAGNPLGSDSTWSFSTLGPPPNEGPGGPILVLSSATNPFSRYYAEILRAEGLNEFTATDISNLTAPLLNNYQVLILGEMTLTSTEVGLITNWVDNGGNLIAMRPDPQLAGLLGLNTAGSTLSEGYLLVNTASTPGQGIVNQTIQYHGTADRYTLNGATSIATLYSNASTATANPAVTMINVGSNGGQAAAFTYDLARSVVYTRQGNPAWEGQNRDGQAGPIRSDNLFFGNAAGDPQLDWVDFNKIQIPQADEQQRLLVNMILAMNADKNPLPHFWYFPRFEKAVVVMTHDEHGGGDIISRLNSYNAASPVGCNIADWECILSTTYMYTNAPITNAQVAAYQNQGHEFAVHVNTGCANFTPASLAADYASQIPALAAQFPSMDIQRTQRTHCIAFSDWSSQPKIQYQNGMRFDTNYYYWPSSWIQDRPGMFTGSGMPMRFADLDGTMIDVYQATTQMTDESGQSYPLHINSLLNNAVGSPGYYGAFTTNIHTDGGANATNAAAAIVNSAQTLGVPVVSALQMLNWVDGRNFSAFSGISWNGNALDFHVSVGGGANGLYALLPTQSNAGPLQSITRNGTPVTYTTETVKGIEYAVFSATPSGDFQAIYSLDTTGPVISNIIAMVNPDGTVTITWDTDEASDSRVDFGTDSNNLNLNSTDSALVTSHSITLTGLTPNTTYYFRVTSADASANSSTSPIAPTTLDFTTPSGSLADTLLTDFNSGTLGCTYPMQIGNGALILTPAIAAEFDGFVLPSGWSSNVWTGTTPTFGSGQVSLNGVSIRNDTLLNAGTSLEFAATFTNQSFQHVGFGGGDPTFNGPPWAMFSTGTDGSQLYARVHTGGGDDVTPLGAAYLGGSHQYRIDWNASSVNFYIDGSLVLTRNIAVPGQMRVAASDLTVADPALVVDWMHVSPYASPCTFTSHVFDAGQAVNWETLSWTGQTPTGTSFAFSYRIGNTPTPDGTWTSFSPVPTSGAALSGNTRYIQYQTVLATSNNLITPVLEDVSITYSLGADITPPTIIGRNPTPNETDVDETGDITVTFSEPMNPATIIPANFSLIVDGPNTPVPFTLTYSGLTATLNPDSDLTPGTQYAVHVDGVVTDLAGNPLGTDSDWTFVTTASGLIDTTVTDFGFGTNACYISETANGELILNPMVSTEFSGATLPAGWSTFDWPYDATPGTYSVAGGSLIVDGMRINPEPAAYGSGRALEFQGTFTASSNQHIGFGAGNQNPSGEVFNTTPWAMFSTGGTGTALLARTASSAGNFDYVIPGSWLGTPHLYRIEWTAANVNYYIDGALVIAHAYNGAVNMRPAISDLNLGGGQVSVDWMRMSPYGTPCAFESRIFDAGSVVDWQNLISTGSTPAGTNVAFETRTGNTPTPDVTWSAWAPTSGVIASPNGQYAQYRVTLSTTDVNVTPIIESVELTYLVVVNHAPTTSSIADVTVDEDASDSTLNLWTSFADLDEPDSALTYSIQSNTNPALFTSATIAGNQNLVLDFAPNQFGTADITIRATDTGGLFVEDTFRVTVNSVNDVPTTTGITNVTVDEDALDTTVDLFPSFADVEDADNALTYTVEANTNATLLTSVTVTGGQNLVLDYAPNASGTANITIRATDTGTDFIETTFTVIVNPVNDAPTDIALTNNTLDENLPIGTLIGTLSTTDVDPIDNFNYSFCGGVNDASFSLSGNQLLTSAIFNYEAQNSYSICIRSTDSGFTFFDETFTITVNNVNEAPTTSGIAPVTVNEDSADTTIDLWTSFADAEEADNLLIYSIENNTNAALFTSVAIAGNQNLVLNYSPNASGTADITIRATDAGGLFVETTFTVTVNAVNDNPTTSGIAPLTVNEDAADSSIDLFPSFADVEDADAQLTYTVTGNTNVALFTSTNIVAGQNLMLDFALNASGTADITVRATDTGGLFVETTFTVTVNAINDNPTTSGIATVNVNEDATDTSIDLWTSFADVEDADNALTYTIEANTNTALFSSVTIAGNQNLVLDFAPNTSGSAQFTIRATDTGGLFIETTFTVNIGIVNDNPTTSGIAPVTVNEDAADTSIDLWTSFTDIEDTDAQMTYTVEANTNAALFTSVTIAGNQNLVLDFAPNTSGTADITIRATDTGGLFIETTFTVTVNAINDNPTTSSIAPVTVNEDAADTTLDLWTSFADIEDADSALTYTVEANTNAALFTAVSILGNQNLVLDYAPNASGTTDITIRATDTGGLFIETTFTVTVNAVNDNPTTSGIAPVTVNEDAVDTSIDLWASFADVEDVDNALTYTIEANTNAALFTSVSITGNQNLVLDYAPNTSGSADITIRATDTGGLLVETTFTVTVNTINDNPTTSGIANVNVIENAPDTTIDLWASFADIEDADNALTYSIEANSNAALFTSVTIAGNQNLVLDYAPGINGSAQITIRATDTGGLFVETTFTVDVTAINDAPLPSAIDQYKTDASTVIAQGGTTNETSVVFKATATDAESNQFTLEVEVVDNAAVFTNTATCTSLFTNSGIETSTGSCGPFAAGSYKWQYRLVDDGGAATAWTAFAGSDPDFIIDNGSPTITNVTSPDADGTYFAGDNITIEVTFNENVFVTGTPQLLLELGAVDGLANYVSGSGSDTLTFTYLVMPGDTTPDLDYVAPTSMTLNGGSVQDNALNNASLSLPIPAAAGSLGANKAIVIDAGLLQVNTNGINSNPDTGDGYIAESELISSALGISELIVRFNKDVHDVPTSNTDPDEVDNPANYILVRSTTGTFNTLSCAGGVVAPDIITPVTSVTYSNGGGSGPFVATVTLSTPITTNGYYRLFVCGTTSIVQANNTALALAGNGIANGTDFIRNFQLVTPAAGGGSGGSAGAREDDLAVAALPATGFAPGRITKLPVQPDELAYTDLGEMWIEIPALGIRTSIVGVPQTADGEWDVTWLANNVGWLNGTAFPTWEGNSVVTAHVTNADGVDGPFANLKKLKYGDQIIIHLYGQKYIFEVRNSRMSKPFTTSFAFEHLEDQSYLTLITCQVYLPKSDTYLYRRVIRAVLVEVEGE